MLHFSRPKMNRSGFSIICGLFLLLGVCYLAADQVQAVETTVPSAKNIIGSIITQQEGDALHVRLQGSMVPTYTVYELFKPARIVVDVAEAELSPSVTTTLPEESGISLIASSISDATPAITRFTFTLPQSRAFRVDEEQNDLIVVLEGVADTSASQQSASTTIEDLTVNTSATETVVSLSASAPITEYSHAVIGKKEDSPPRLYVDINNVNGDKLLKEQTIGTSLAKIRVAKRGSGLRIVFEAATDTLFPFQVVKRDRGLDILIQETAGNDQLGALIEKQTGRKKSAAKETVQTAVAAISEPTPLTASANRQDSFGFAGFDKDRITVDFYKIDLHNVFRLLREVSGANLIVDEAVGGSLTLALNDVPWDFALDIILNLKNLQKEERYNTIVIFPKSKEFLWPERATDTLSFEADETVTKQEAIIIEQLEKTSKEILTAKQFIGKGKEFETREEFEYAIGQYEKALALWPENTNLANKISSIYLVQLRQNAKALFYAKKALAANTNNTRASLNAAIALANMQNNGEAQLYFDQCVSTAKPSSEALLSYAVFSEEQQQYDGALKLLRKHDEVYGASLNSMVAAARIYDKQGQDEQATATYKGILLSGFRIPADLSKYIKGRIALSQSM